MFTSFQTTISLVLRTEIHLTITFLRHHDNRRIHCYAPGESLTTFWHPVMAAEHYSIWLKDTYLLTHRLMDTIPTVALQLRLSSAWLPSSCTCHDHATSVAARIVSPSYLFLFLPRSASPVPLHLLPSRLRKHFRGREL